MDYVLKTNALCKHYKDFKALNGLTMNVPKGSIYGFVGKNGAGKTTLIRLVCGLQLPTSGSFELYGVEHSDKEISKSRRRMGAVVETPSIYLDMTAEDNLKQQYRILGMPSFDGISELLKLVGLENTGRKRAKNFSRELILKLNREQKITVLISSHILDELSRLATHYGFIDSGRIVREMSAEELEAACRKCMRITVTDTAMLASVLDEMGLEYSVIDDKKADIYAKPNITQLSLALAKDGCEVLSLEEHDESLESFYISLVGGADND